MAPVVTLSATYGAYGDKIGPAVAERLGLLFLDRAIPPAMAHELAQSTDVAESLDEPVPSRWERLAMGFANAAMPVGPSHLPPEAIPTPERFRQANEERLKELADSTGAVILGRAGMVVLGNRADVLCVRLDGPVEARIAQVIARGADEQNARKAQREVDRARDAFAKVFFNVRQDDPRLYHVVLDSTILSVEACVDIIVRAALDRFGSSSAESRS
jgi:Cytidylate kinase-like family